MHFVYLYNARSCYHICKTVSINYINARVATVQAVNIIDRQDKVVVVNVSGGGEGF